MAHVQKFTVGAMGGLCNHYDRKTENHSNQDIDNSRSHLNYNLYDSNLDTVQRLKERLSEVYCMKRDDVKPFATWVVTLPEELKEKGEDAQYQFFKETYEFLKERYGGEKNVLSANVHNDETTPHMHFVFTPVVWDEKKQREKISAKQVLNRTDLKSFHSDLDKHLREKIPSIYQTGILNDKTVGIDDVKSLKKYSNEIQKQKEVLSKELDLTRKDVQMSKNELLALNKDVSTDLEVKVKYQTRNIEVPTGEKNIFGIEKKEIKKERTGNVILPELEFKKLRAAAKDNKRLLEDVNRYLKTDVIKRNQELSKNTRILREQLERERKEKEKLEKENSFLKGEIRQLNSEIKALAIEVRSAYEGIKEFMKEHTKADSFKELFKVVVDKISRRSREEREPIFENPKGKFERIFDEEKTKEARANSRSRSKDCDMER